MKSFKEFLSEGTHAKHEDDVHGMGKVFSQFLQHLTSPTWDEGKLNEVTVYNANNPRLSGRTLTKSAKIIKQGNRDLPEGNLHKHIAKGFTQAFSEMETEHPDETAAKLKEAKDAFAKFAQSRGFKGAPALLNDNGKTRKGEGVSTVGLSLAPHTANGLKGFDVCPRASTDCRANCLGTEAGGNRMFPDSALASKIVKTHFLAMHPHHAARLLDHEIGQHVKAAKKSKMIAGVRLNVTSDIPYEKFAKALFARHPTAQFYDYTKMHKRVLDQESPDHPKNYHLSLSHTGTGHAESNDRYAIEALNRGHVVAMVYQRGKDVPHPTHVEDVKTGKRWRVANGDDDDNTFDRHATIGESKKKGVVSGLKLKGVKNEDAGAFANKVDADGVIRINK